jgi:DNA-binding Xre family transcriptional regulator
MILRSKLAQLMEREGVDQKTLAAETGLSPATVGKLYHSHFSRIDNHTVVALLKRFKLSSLDDLIEVVLEEGD